jgi:hypothetical protein
MPVLAEQIMAHAEALPEGAPVTANALLHLGARTAVSRALSRLARRGRLLRIGRGLYVRPVQGRFGLRPPTVEAVVRAVAGQRGEIVASHGAAAANALGLTTQAPIRMIYLTSGPSRMFKLSQQSVELRRAPTWQLLLADRPAGEVIRALAWLGPEKAAIALKSLRGRLAPSVFDELLLASLRLPTWLGRLVSQARDGRWAAGRPRRPVRTSASGPPGS